MALHSGIEKPGSMNLPPGNNQTGCAQLLRRSSKRKQSSTMQRHNRVMIPGVAHATTFGKFKFPVDHGVFSFLSSQI